MIIEVWDPHRLLWDEPYKRARVLELKKGANMNGSKTILPENLETILPKNTAFDVNQRFPSYVDLAGEDRLREPYFLATVVSEIKSLRKGKNFSTPTEAIDYIKEQPFCDYWIFPCVVGIFCRTADKRYVGPMLAGVNVGSGQSAVDNILRQKFIKMYKERTLENSIKMEAVYNTFEKFPRFDIFMKELKSFDVITRNFEVEDFFNKKAKERMEKNPKKFFVEKSKSILPEKSKPILPKFSSVTATEKKNGVLVFCGVDREGAAWVRFGIDGEWEKLS